MIEKTGEFSRMFAVEEKLWWYRHLHDLVIQSIQKRFGARTDVAILDAGCGTGGLLHRLQLAGYSNIRGLDGSAEGVAFCRARNLPVQLINLNDLATYAPHEQTGALFDVIVCNDVFCYFRDPELKKLMHELSVRLRPNGVLISNNNAFLAFKGEHDLAVGSLRRFVTADFVPLTTENGLHIKAHTYWSFVLSPLILLVRQWQALQLRMRGRPTSELVSDVELPAPLINDFLYKLVGLERKLLPSTPFGSSLFLEIEPVTKPL